MDKVVIKEEIVYVDRIVDRPVEVEKVVFRDRVVEVEKIVTKEVPVEVNSNEERNQKRG